MKRYLRSAIVIFLSSFVILFGALAHAEKPQSIVIGLQGNPYDSPEPACVAIQLGALLLQQSKHAEVTLFASVDGVGIADANELNGDNGKLECNTLIPNPDYPEDPDAPQMILATIDLFDVVSNYLNAGGKMLACPMCWVVYSQTTIAGLIPPCSDDVGEDEICSPEAGQVISTNPAPLLLNADKSFDY